MARIRTIKPEFFRNRKLFLAERTCGLPLRVAFAGLFTVADREGRFRWIPDELKLDCLPYDDLDFSAVLDQLVTLDAVRPYQVDGRHYGYIPSWHDHQAIQTRESASKLPEPLGTCIHVHAQGEGKGRELEREGKGTDRSAALLARFDRFWAEYPRKEGKDAARKEWLQRSPDDALTDLMIAKVCEQRASAQWLRDGGQYIPHPRTWLHQGRWQDETKRIPQMNAKSVRTMQGVYGD